MYKRIVRDIVDGGDRSMRQLEPRNDKTQQTVRQGEFQSQERVIEGAIYRISEQLTQ